MKTPFLGAILFYIVVLWFFGWVASRRSKGSEGYLVADRRFSTALVSALVAGTWVGGVAVVGMAQGAFLHGFSACWFMVGMWVAMCLTAAFLPKIITGRKTYSILDVVIQHYDRRTANVAGIFQLIFSVWVVTMNIVGGGAILSFILKETITLSLGMILTTLVFSLYLVLGGVVAAAYTNLIHLITIFLGIITGGLFLLVDTGGMAVLRTTVPSFYFKPFGDLGPWMVFSWLLVNLTLCVLAQPVINAGASAKSLSHGRLGILIGTLLAIPVPLIAALCGVIAKCRYPEVASIKALPVLLGNLPSLIALFFLLGMWAPLMSAGSSFLMGATTIVIRGYFIRILPQLSDRRILVASRITTLVLAGMALFLSFSVVEILRSVTEIAVLLTSVVILVAMAGILKNPSKKGGFLSLIVSFCFLILSISTGWDKKVHPFWMVFPATLLIMLVSTWIEQKLRKNPYLTQTGHSQISTTMRYTHLRAEDTKEALESLRRK